MRIEDLAKKFGVSTATISRALNAATANLVSEPLRSQIQSYARKKSFTPNPIARHLAHGRSHTIGAIVYTGFGSLFFTQYLADIQWGITTALEDHPGYGCKIVLLPRGKLLSEVDHHILGSGVDGLLISTLTDFNLKNFQEPVRAIERRWEHPIVAINTQAMKNNRISTVSFSNFEGAYQAVKHLIRKGHHKIGLIYTDDGAPDVAERVAAFKTALADHRIPFDAGLTSEGAYLMDSGYDATIQLFKRPRAEKLTAVFCTNDEMAFGVLRALRVLRKRCPENVAVMGFDGLMAGEQVEPSLSTVKQPFFQTAKEGTRLLINLIEGRQKQSVQLTLPSQLIVRNSA